MLIYKSIINSGHLPSTIQRGSNLSTNLKNTPENDTANYHISNLPSLGDAIETAVEDQPQDFLDNSFALDPFQPGSRLGYGMETGMMALVDDLHLNVDKSQASLLLLLDSSAAFDTGDHAILLRCLGAEVGIGIIH